MFKYIVKPEERIVIAVMRSDDEPMRYDAINFIEKQEVCNIPAYDYYSYCIRDQYVGVARCHELDRFDVEYGKELAKRRALTKHHKDFQKAVNRYLVNLAKAENVMRRRVENKIVNNEKNILDLLK